MFLFCCCVTGKDGRSKVSLSERACCFGTLPREQEAVKHPKQVGRHWLDHVKPRDNMKIHVHDSCATYS